MRKPDTGSKVFFALLAVAPPLKEAGAVALKDVLAACGGNATHAAKVLGVSTSQPLLRLVEKLDLVEWLETLRRNGGVDVTPAPSDASAAQ